MGTLEFIGSVIEPGAHSGGAVRHRAQKASSVFYKWKPLLCNPNLSLKERMKAFGASTLSSATWLSGCWTLSKQQEQASESKCARLLSQMVGFKRNPNDDFATFWKKHHRKGHDLARAELICTFALNTVSRCILPVLSVTILCIRWCAGIWLGGVSWNVVETHEQWVGLRLRRTSASGKLVKAHFSPHVADFV